MKYEKPNLEELEIILEGSFLDHATGDPNTPDVSVVDGEGGDDKGDDYWN